MLNFVYVYFNEDKNFINFKNFIDLIKFLDKTYRGVVVNNSREELSLNCENVTVINGSNKFYEFSAYQEGYEYLSKFCILGDRDVILIANDTLFSNHFYTFPTRYYIRYLLGKSKKLSHYLIGELDGVNGRQFTSWISSYFFISNKSTLQKITPFFIEESLYISIVQGTNPPEIKWGNFFCKSIQNEIQSWLDPKNRKSWYLQHKKFFNQQHFNIKLFNIVNERLLTDRLKESGTKLIDIRGSLVTKLCRLFEMKVFIKIVKKFY
jgi:hypothetical protein